MSWLADIEKYIVENKVWPILRKFSSPSGVGYIGSHRVKRQAFTERKVQYSEWLISQASNGTNIIMTCDNEYIRVCLSVTTLQGLTPIFEALTSIKADIKPTPNTAALKMAEMFKGVSPKK